jgi:Holliday junction resolvase RusA-like endonuclease
MLDVRSPGGLNEPRALRDQRERKAVRGELGRDGAGGDAGREGVLPRTSIEGVTDYRPCASCKARGFAVAGEFAYGCMRCEHTSITFEVLGIPAPKGSVSAGINSFTGRAFVVAGGKKATRDKMKAWTTCVREAAIALLGNDRQSPLFVDRPLVVDVVFRMPRPAKHWSKKGGLLPSAPKFPHHKPDRDKLLRNTCDALTGLVYDDDCRPCDGRTRKEYATPGREGATITVRPMDT